MDKKVIAGSVVSLLAPLLVSPIVSLADQVPSTAQSSVIAGQPSSAVSQTSPTLNSSQQQQGTLVGEGGQEPGNVKLVNPQTGSSQVAWGFDKDVTNEVDPVHVSNNGAGTNAVGIVPFPFYQNQGDLVSALTAKGLSQEQISSVIAAMMLTERGTYKSDFTPISGMPNDMQAEVYNYQVQMVLDVLVGQVDQHQANFIKQHFTPFQQKLYNAALAKGNVSVDDMTTAYLVAPGSTEQSSKLQLNMQTKTTSQFELNPNYLGAPVKVNQILSANYQIIDVATNQPVNELSVGHTYYVKTSEAVAAASVAMQYAKEVFNFFDTKDKTLEVSGREIRDGVTVTPHEVTQIPLYYDADGNYIGTLQSYQGHPIVNVTGQNGYQNVAVMWHLYDQNQNNRLPDTTYVGLMTSSTVMKDLTLRVFADVPVQSSSSSTTTSQPSNSQETTVAGKSSSTTNVVQSAEHDTTVAPVRNTSGKLAVNQKRVVNAQTLRSTVSAYSHKQKLPATGNYQAKGLAGLGMVLVGLGLGFIGWKRRKQTH